jgi:hypothetical protein
MLIKTIRSIKIFSTGLIHSADCQCAAKFARCTFLGAGLSAMIVAMTSTEQQTKSRKTDEWNPRRIRQNGKFSFQTAARHFLCSPKFIEYEFKEVHQKNKGDALHNCRREGNC